MADKGSGGRPPNHFDWKVLDALLQRDANLTDCSEIMGHCEDTIQRRIRRKYKCTFKEYRYRKGALRRMKLREVIFDMATVDKNTTVAIHLCKEMLGHSTTTTQKLEHTSPDGTMTPKAESVVIYLPDNGRGDNGTPDS